MACTITGSVLNLVCSLVLNEIPFYKKKKKKKKSK